MSEPIFVSLSPHSPTRDQNGKITGFDIVPGQRLDNVSKWTTYLMPATQG